jgi:predicted DNA-binding protein YlxM (UPF0122 family)
MSNNSHDILVLSKANLINYLWKSIILLTYVSLSYIYIISFFEVDIVKKINDLTGCFFGSVIFLFIIIFTPINNRFIITKEELIIIKDKIVKQSIHIPCSTITGHALGSKYQFKLGEIFILTIKQGEILSTYYFFELSKSTINKLAQLHFSKISDNIEKDINKRITYKYGISLLGIFFVIQYIITLFFVAYYFYIIKSA